MKPTAQPTWTAPILIAGALLAARADALSDANAELKEAAADRVTQRLVARAAPAPQRQALWVPTPAKRLDRFEPVLPRDDAPAPGLTLAATAPQR